MSRRCGTKCPCHRSWTDRFFRNRVSDLMHMEARLDPEWAYRVAQLEALFPTEG